MKNTYMLCKDFALDILCNSTGFFSVVDTQTASKITTLSDKISYVSPMADNVKTTFALICTFSNC